MCVFVIQSFYLWVTKLSNLLYADDLILISETKTGLQSCLDQSASITARSGKSWSTIKRQKSWLWKKDDPQLKYIVSVSKIATT